MPNQKISELTAIVTVDNSVDLLPIVDTSANTTKKITPTALKSALALDNVNNTSDANKPVSTAQQDALDAKVTANAAITAGTAPKVTFDAKGLVTSGDSLDETDLPTGINANKIGTGVVSTTEFEYLNGVTSAIQTQIDSKQATLVSGTNIKTLNSTSLLGSGDIVLTANPSGVSGAIQFSNGSAFASDATNLFWDDTNKRLGVGTNAPDTTAHFKGGVAGSVGVRVATFEGNLPEILFKDTNNNTGFAIAKYGGLVYFVNTNSSGAYSSYSGLTNSQGQWSFGGGFNPSGTVHIKGSGSTSATTSLLVQNSGGSNALQVRDDRVIIMEGLPTSASGLPSGALWNDAGTIKIV